MPKVQEKGQVTLARDLREKLGIQPGDEVQERLVKAGDVVPEAGILVTPKRSPLSKWIGFLGPGDSDEMMRELRGDP